MIRLTTSLPSVVLHVAFIGGTPGDLRHKASFVSRILTPNIMFLNSDH